MTGAGASGAGRGAGFRVGHGYDLHRLEVLAPVGAGRPLVIGGVRVEGVGAGGAVVGPVGHSDGDALFHAVTDALLGALSMPDIGQLFPDTDPRHEGQDSEVFLAEAVRRVRAAGWGVVNVDATVILERPKIGAVKEKIRGNLARVLGVEVGCVNVKGKTHERVDAVGEGRAIEVHVVVLLGK
jgi:2-C-methyl-D-erythritol 2,4-cyclodiphosphate synthase